MMALALVLMLSLFAPSLQTPLAKSYANTSTKFGPLKFRNDGNFQIAVFEDLHFGENAWDTWGPQQDINSVKVINGILDSEDPDLVVLNGDLITGNNAFKHNATVYVDQIVQPLVNRSLTWASTYGNHDSDYNLSRRHILDREHEYPNARTRSMVPGESAGVSNYYLPVYNSTCAAAAPDDGSCVPELILWFFDSRGGNYYQQLNGSGAAVPQPCWVDESVVRWFNETRQQLSRNFSTLVPSLAFVHIPVTASQALQRDRGVDPNLQPGVNDDNPLAAQAQGWCANGTVGCAYGGQDIPFMEALVATEGLMGVFSGHDHGDTWCYKWEGILPGMNVTGSGLNLCFGQRSGYAGYGTWIRGSRQIMVSRNQLGILAVDTWIRTEKATMIGAITLNSTYGSDQYAESPDDHTACPSCVYS